jgi:hypothetical protein
VNIDVERLLAVRAVAAAAAVALAVVACAPTTDVAGPEDRTATPDVSDGPVPPAGAPSTPPDAPATAGDATAPPHPDVEGDAGDGDSDAGRTPVDDLGPVGANGRAMLRGDRSRLVIEVDVQEGLRPTQAALDHLVASLREHADKPGGVELAGGNTFASDRTTWTAQDLRDVAATHRSTASDGGTVSFYVLYVRGGFVAGGEETNAVGVAHRASEIAVFPERWRGLGDLLGGDPRLERAVLVHELGHALGLVELTYESDHPRQDPEHPGHSSNRGSVMFWAVETDLVGQVLGGPPPDRFDADDAADLAALRDGR